MGLEDFGGPILHPPFVGGPGVSQGAKVGAGGVCTPGTEVAPSPCVPVSRLAVPPGWSR